MPKRKPISKQQRRAIRTYAKQGYSANKIQKKLKNQGLGIQRKKLLAEVRKITGTKPKANSYKYTPKKYRKKFKGILPPPKLRRKFLGRKSVAVYLSVKTKRHPKPYSARFEFYGSGKDQYKAVMLVFRGIVPRYEYPFVECSARDFVKNPYLYGEKGFWIDKPIIES